MSHPIHASHGSEVQSFLLAVKDTGTCLESVWIRSGIASIRPGDFPVIGLVLMVLLSALATILPATMGPRADPLTTPEVIKPEWFFYVMFRWLKLFSATVAILTTGLAVFAMFIWPFIDGWIRRRWPASEASVWIGVVAVFTIVGLTVWEAMVRH